MAENIRGFVDLQVNGWNGTDFSAPGLTDEACAAACRGILASGTAAFLPTMVTSAAEVYAHNLPVIARVRRLPEFRARVPGIHLEGPFISPEDGARGAHPLACVRDPDPDFLNRLMGWSDGSIRLLTVAAERPGADPLIAAANAAGIVVSLGHQLAPHSRIAAAAAAGAKALTHLGNGMPAMVNRHANPLLDALACDALCAMIITDGHHLPPALIRLILRVKGAGGVIVTSDATALSGMPPGAYRMFGATVVRDHSGKVYNPETGYLAGSGSSIFECMNHLAALGVLSEEDLLRVGFRNALNLIGTALDPEIRAPVYDAPNRRFLHG